MDKMKSTVADKTDSTDQASISSKIIRTRQWANFKANPNILLIWLDNDIDEENNIDCRNTINQLRCVVNTIHTFIDADQCIDFLTNIDNQKAVMIISGPLCRNTVPLTYDIAQLDTIFIFCKNEKRHEQWSKNWPKIKGVFTEMISICEALKQIACQYEQNAMSMSFINTNDSFSRRLNQLDSSFMYTQIIKEILLTIQFEQKHITEFIDYLKGVFAENKDIVIKISEFERKYRDATPIWWYTYEFFLYSTLNRALRTMEVDVIIKMGFFIGDLYRHIEQLHSAQFDEYHSGAVFTVYRGQGLSKTDFEQLKKTNGGLISFNNFLSTSKDRDVSLLFAESNQADPDLVGILFVMGIDPSKSTTPFASVNGISYFEEEDEILFSMHTIFRIRDIKPMGENLRLFQVDLILTSNDDKDLRMLTHYIREETQGGTAWSRLGQLLIQMGQMEQAQRVYQFMLSHRLDEREKASIYYRLGTIRNGRGEYKEAIKLLEKAIEIYQKNLPSGNLNMSACYNKIGEVYEKNGEYSRALLYYEKSLEIKQRTLPPSHRSLASSWKNIGAVYEKTGEYSKALSSHEKSLEIERQSLPPTHPDLANTYCNIGIIYDNMGEYSKALPFCEKALEINQQSLPPNHPSLAATYYNIGLVYFNMAEYPKALSFHEKALEIRRHLLPATHPSFALSYDSIGLVYQKMNKHSKALSSYEKAFAIRQQSLFPNHPAFASTYNNMGWVHEEMDNYLTARSFYERAVDIAQHSLPSNHPHHQIYNTNLESIKKRLY